MKKARRCSILVCGAGPAGSSAALAAARAGAGVLVLERRRLVGVPVRCAEYIPAPLAGSVPGAAMFWMHSPCKKARMDVVFWTM